MPVSLQDELDRLRATGCPDGHIAAVIGRWADFAEQCRVLADKKVGNRGTAAITVRIRASAGRQLIPEEMETARGCPLGHTHEEPS